MYVKIKRNQIKEKHGVMRKFTSRAISMLIALGFLTQLLFVGGARASSLSGSGYKIFPIRRDITINRGASDTVSVYIQNVSSAVENVQTIFDDFVANPNESGSPSLLLNGNSTQHGLKQFVKTSPLTFTLQPGAEQKVTITITIPKYAAPGGYYGAVRFAPASFYGRKNVNLSASVASLILVKVPGNYQESMNILNFSAAQNGIPRGVFTSSKNLQAIVTFQNTGQIQEEPFGKVVLMKGSKTLGIFPVNNVTPPGNVLPNSARKFIINLSGAGAIGKYTLIGNFGYGSKGQLLTASTSFWIVPINWIIAFIVVLVIILILIFLWLRNRAKKTQTK